MNTRFRQCAKVDFEISYYTKGLRMFRGFLLHTRRSGLRGITRASALDQLETSCIFIKGPRQRRWSHQKNNEISLQDLKLQEIIKSANVGAQKRTKESVQTDNENPKVELNEFEDSSSRGGAESSSKSQPSFHGRDEKSTENSKKSNDISVKIASGIDSIHREIQNLPSQVEKKRSEISVKTESFFDSLQKTLFRATRTLNDVTGYSAIEKLKDSIQKLEDSLQESKEKVKSCKIAYSKAIEGRSASQKEINELLTRKHNWTAQDVERFTELYRNDHINEQNEHMTQEQLEQAEAEVDAVQLKLTQSILTRYHEEQIWSDKIRRASTWGTWILTGINIFIFIIATLVVEPWKRSRLVDSFERKLQLALAEHATERTTHVGTATNAIDKNLHSNEQTIKDNNSPNTLAMSKGDTGAVTPATSNLFASNAVAGPWWSNIKQNIVHAYEVFFSKNISKIEVKQSDLAIAVTAFCLLSSGITSIVLSYWW